MKMKTDVKAGSGCGCRCGGGGFLSVRTGDILSGNVILSGNGIGNTIVTS